ncbi:DUF3553 domain-containing protein [Komagataeibacter sp. AV436]|uniref:DUF3553 domain-containing protein n=1 Tax=Komagataeibacter melomenusus TaxID=2766578 RepID=A0ABX2A9H4_9PROT|nr:DUF3553 domain-containing protein [Komagataeibacter melomenusus]MBV1829394.1 DUF3553 domain-containing protein [Komagataeibacter melomenusus]NPC64965.1 DUF3553 domain-containing protein [Komagataeibacter melomenusus]
MPVMTSMQEPRSIMAPPPFRSFLVPGQLVRHPDHPEWGDGAVQSAIGARVTVMFPHAGKVMVNAMVVQLTELS